MIRSALSFFLLLLILTMFFPRIAELITDLVTRILAYLIAGVDTLPPPGT